MWLPDCCAQCACVLGRIKGFNADFSAQRGLVLTTIPCPQIIFLFLRNIQRHSKERRTHASTWELTCEGAAGRVKQERTEEQTARWPLLSQDGAPSQALHRRVPTLPCSPHMQLSSAQPTSR